MASNKQRGENIMVFGTDEFIEAGPTGLRNEAIRFFESMAGYVFREAEGAGYISKEEWEEVLGLPFVDPTNYLPIKFMLTCFILLELGEEF